MPHPGEPKPHHSLWVRISHWIITFTFFSLVFTGIEILMVHPRLYWGEVGNDLTPALIELPISRNYRHGGYSKSVAFFDSDKSIVSANRTYDIFNQNGWGRSLHFLSAWILVITGGIYLLMGVFTGHFRRRILPTLRELLPQSIIKDLISHWRSRPVASSEYNLLQRISYMIVIFFLFPCIAISGLTMSPAITAAFPFLLDASGGLQSARTSHFLLSLALESFLIVHFIMVILSGFKQQLRGMIIGK
ncbi:MAG: cytochrome b/b6 domain-containing protein [Bacteroidota bacterium]